MSRLFLGSVAACALACAFSANAQVFYEPVQYQHVRNGNVMYYGGSNPDILRRTAYPSMGSSWGRVNGYAFVSGNITTHREVSHEVPVRVYSDYAYAGWNAALFGFTAADAYNEAMANAPRYYRKADLLASAELASDGTWVVPASAPDYNGRGEVLVYRYRDGHRVAPATQPVLKHGAILIIPKKALMPPPAESDKGVVMAE